MRDPDPPSTVDIPTELITEEEDIPTLPSGKTRDPNWVPTLFYTVPDLGEDAGINLIPSVLLVSLSYFAIMNVM